MIRISRIIFSILFIIYILLTPVLFVVTSIGWTGLTFMFYGLIFIALSLILITLFLIVLKLKKIKIIVLSPLILGIMVVFQTVAILLNVGDGTSTTCFYIFRYFDIGGKFGCIYSYSQMAEVLSFIHQLALILYLIFFILFIKNFWSKTLEADKSK